jgi:hypothetical protein
MMRGAPLFTLLALSAAAVAGPVTPFSTASGATLPPPWEVITLPKIPRHTQYSLATVDRRVVVRAEASASYANVVHPLDMDISATPVLHFAWRADRFPADSDLLTRQGDDLAAKVCVLFDVPLDRLGFVDRVRIELGRRLFDPKLPSATVCYVWDRQMTAGTWLPNAYTNRVRYLVLRSAAAGEQGRWFDERRDLRSDFVQAFGKEGGDRLPPVVAIAFATDADNTGSSALAYYGDIELRAE